MLRSQRLQILRVTTPYLDRVIFPGAGRNDCRVANIAGRDYGRFRIELGRQLRIQVAGGRLCDRVADLV